MSYYKYRFWGMRNMDEKLKRTLLIQLLIIICFNAIFIHSKENTGGEFYANDLESIYFEFESDLTNWTLTFETEGSNLFLTNSTSYNGNSSACMTNRTTYTYYLFDENKIKMTNNTMITFSWGFPNKEGHYIGFMIGTTLATLCIMSHFNWAYVNTSLLIIKSYKYESINTWHYHTLNISNFYISYFGTIPEYINTFGLRNRGPGTMADTIPGDQIAYYDSIFISTNGTVLEPNTEPKPIPEIENYTDPYLKPTEPFPTEPTPTSPESGFTINLSTLSVGHLFGSIFVICSIIISYKKRKKFD